METWANHYLIGGGLILGLLFGVVGQRSRFCMAAAVSNVMLMKDFRQFQAYLAAVVIAVLGTQLLEFGDWVSVADSTYRHAPVSVLGLAVGGLLFGIGTVFAGGCIGRILVRTGEGHVSALLALGAISLGATMAFVGFLETPRIWLLQVLTIELKAGDASLASLLGLPLWLLVTSITLIMFGTAILLVRRAYDQNRTLLQGGVAIGMLVVVGWFLTGYLAHDDFNPVTPASMSFAGPLTRTALLLTVSSSPVTYFSIVLVFGVLLGSFSSAYISGSFRITAPDAKTVIRTLGGGLLMGVGAMLAGGCNIGHGITGLSTLSVSSILAITMIVVGMILGMRWSILAEEYGSLWRVIKPFHSIASKTEPVVS